MANDRVVFLRPDAERIARVVRAVENGGRDQQPLTFSRVIESGGGKVIRACKFSGSWGLNATKTITFRDSTQTFDCINNIMDMNVGGSNCNAVAGKDGGDWYLLSMDLTRQVGYTGGRQVLGSDAGTLRWWDTEDCES